MQCEKRGNIWEEEEEKDKFIRMEENKGTRFFHKINSDKNTQRIIKEA